MMGRMNTLLLKRGSRKFLGRVRGFTLIELLVVLAIIALLLTLAVPRYFHTLDGSKESILAENLHATRDAIDKFYGDTGRYPDTLQELVDRHYLRTLPVDPVTESSSTWIIVAPDEQFKGGVYNIKSGAPGNNRNGVAFGDL
jgi:general secretion pathway protein G